MLRDEINEALKAAVKSQDRRSMATLRLVNAAIKDRDIAARTSGKDCVSDDDIRQILAKMIRQREESAATYMDAGRPELAAQEREEIEIIQRFLPRQLSDEEIRSVCASVVKEIGAAGLRDMGRTMATLKERFPGQLDFGRASAVVKGMLS
ncbi:hypothetical protein EDC22_101573 [Tepidamorphus gemmatus]|uniref:GatB/YqeY domain-containing protein n=1 Tax=Tepidamorphus gemmatus TaxID=747076 RepID=A0A4R3MJ93_9HYPH|nr:GatB/YqeY domain-containing protein [Tepidamorphus gemmatus]TCT13702.1 hypothetical protein EDC22_101573 [Tepidamorphus gemmatus]